MPRKSLILYSSHTGNTEKVALRFKQVFEKKGWQCDVLKCTKYLDKKNPPYYLDDYDMLCVGAPILAGVPAKEVFGGMLSTRLYKVQKGTDWKGSFTIDVPFGTKKGIIFVTYTGMHRGPSEAIPAIDLIKLVMENLRVKVVGKFACPGKTWTHNSVDGVAEKMKWSVEDASSALSRYKANPNNPEFTSMSKEARKILDDAIADTRDIPEGYWTVRPWHWNCQNRPSERDLTKAEIFIEEILEDFYEQGVEAANVTDEYTCIS